MPVGQFDEIAGHQCLISADAGDPPTNSWTVFCFYKPVREWIPIARRPDREEAIKEAELVLSDRQRLGCALISYATIRINAYQEMVAARHPNRGVPFGDDLPLTERDTSLPLRG